VPLLPAVAWVPAGVFTAFGAWLTVHSADNYSTCTALGILGPGDCNSYRGGEIAGVVIVGVGVGLGVWALVLQKKWGSRKRIDAVMGVPAATDGAVGSVVASPGWFPHPLKPGHSAYWDGRSWTFEKPPDGELRRLS
jgi:Protein of unknown function (DUF2510)